MYRIIKNIKSSIGVFSLCARVVTNHLFNIFNIFLFLIVLIKYVSMLLPFANLAPYLLDYSAIFQASSGMSTMP